MSERMIALIARSPHYQRRRSHFPPGAVNQTAQMIKSDGTLVEQVKIKGGRGHLNGVYAIDQAGARIAEFLGRK